MSRLTDWIEAQAAPDPSQPITGVPIKQRRRHKEDSITLTLLVYAAILLLSIVVAQVSIRMGW
jgi:hypothetical protein